MRQASTTWWTKAVQNRMIALIMAMVVIVPFLASPATAYNSSRGAAALVIEVFGLALLVTLVWRARYQITSSDVVTFLKTGANTPVLLFLLLVCASAIFSPQRGFSLQEALRIGCGALVYFVVAYQFRRSEHITRLVDILTWVAIGAAFISCVEFGSTADEQQYATGLFGDHQLLGSFMMILLPLVGVTAITERAPTRKLIAQVATVLTVVALLLSHSRSAWIGSAVGMTALGILALVLNSNRGKYSHRKHEAVLPLGLLAVAIGFFFLVSPQAASIVDRAQTLTHARTTRGWQYRERMWMGALQMVKEHPLTGVGVGLFPYREQQFTNSGAPIYSIRNAQNGDLKRPSLSEQAHNSYLQTAAELGLPGLLLFIAIPLSFLIFGVIRVRTMDEGIRRTVLLSAIGAVVAFVVDAAGSPAWQLGQVSLFFWVILGLGVGSLRPRSKHYTPRSEEVTPEVSPYQRFARFASVAGAIGGLALLPSVNYACQTDYTDPTGATLTPKDATISVGLKGTAGTFETYTLQVTFSGTGNQLFDVTDCAATTFTANPGTPEFQWTPTKNVYQAGPKKGDIGTTNITGSFTQNGVTVSDTTTLTVQLPTIGGP
ncbi:MAG TPA: O-antigen ligase family protein [Chthonomonadaceae bacterium]|nr:O-antigen ligase family protein [Chthonomonadaceae bacterium]